MCVMRKSYRCFRLLCCVVGMLNIVVAPRHGLGQQLKLSAAMNNSLRAYLQQTSGPGDKTERYAAALVNGDEVVVYLTGRTECGTGGCSLLILRPDGSSFKEIGYATTVWPPIRVLRTQTNGRMDIGAFSQWGVGDQGQELALKFDGNRYVKTQAVTDGAAGHILIPNGDQGILLFGH
jgi:hypothetical protein